MPDIMKEINKKEIGDALMFLLDAEYDENGDIRCLNCGRPNECCRCITPERVKGD